MFLVHQMATPCCSATATGDLAVQSPIERGLSALSGLPENATRLDSCEPPSFELTGSGRDESLTHSFLLHQPSSCFAKKTLTHSTHLTGLELLLHESYCLLWVCQVQAASLREEERLHGSSWLETVKRQTGRKAEGSVRRPSLGKKGEGRE